MPHNNDREQPETVRNNRIERKEKRGNTQVTEIGEIGKRLRQEHFEALTPETGIYSYSVI
jgi:hypothetical protein